MVAIDFDSLVAECTEPLLKYCALDAMTTDQVEAGLPMYKEMLHLISHRNMMLVLWFRGMVRCESRRKF